MQVSWTLSRALIYQMMCTNKKVSSTNIFSYATTTTNLSSSFYVRWTPYLRVHTQCPLSASLFLFIFRREDKKSVSCTAFSTAAWTGVHGCSCHHFSSSFLNPSRTSVDLMFVQQSPPRYRHRPHPRRPSNRYGVIPYY